MSEGDFLYVDQSESYQRIINMDGVRTTVCANRFEIATTTDGVISLFNQLAELCRSYDRFDLTTTTI